MARPLVNRRGFTPQPAQLAARSCGRGAPNSIVALNLTLLLGSHGPAIQTAVRQSRSSPVFAGSLWEKRLSDRPFGWPRTVFRMNHGTARIARNSLTGKGYSAPSWV